MSDIVSRFYDAMKAKDTRAMADLYAINALFTDPVFPSLSGYEAGKMWEMLLKNSQDFDLEYTVLDANKDHAKVRWIARYTFSKTGRRVRNEVVSTFEFMDGKILTQRDRFNFKKWTRQALGFVPWLFSFTGVTQKKVQETAGRSLNDYIRLHA
jgi:ketosteroid isomerase-like protein